MEPRAQQPVRGGPPLTTRFLAALDRLTPDLTLFALAAIIAVTIVFQFQYLPRFVPYSQTTKRMDFGPWAGIYTTPQRYDYLRQFTTTCTPTPSRATASCSSPAFPAGYLMWPYRMAANTVWITNADGITGPLPKTTYDYFERQNVVPDVVFRMTRTAPGTPKRVPRSALGWAAVPPDRRAAGVRGVPPAARLHGRVGAGALR